MYAITVDKLTRQFNGFVAVDHISFTVNAGELFGVLGPNGAGKTTTINMLSTLLKPTSGYAEVAGHNVSKDKDNVRRNIGIVFQEPALDDKLTGKENLEFHAMMYGMNKADRRERIKEVLELVELTDIKILNKEHNVTIILTTHYMEEADYLCDRIGIIDQGKIIALDTSANLKDLLGGDVVSLEIEGDDEELMTHLKELGWVKAIKKHDKTLYLTMEKGKRRIPELISIAQKLGITVLSVNLREPSLEDVFLHFTGKAMREKEAGQKGRSREMARRRMGR